MSNVLLMYDDLTATLIVEHVLSTLQIKPIPQVLDDFDADFFPAEIFDLIIFELFGERSSCISILKQLEKRAATSGIDHPPVIVVTEQGADVFERALRIAKVNFFFVKPLAEAELVAAIQQSLLHSKAS